jgi:hypothetical protein
MTVSPDVPPVLVEQWRSAVADAGLDENQVHLLALSGRPAPGKPKAASYPAGHHLSDDPEDIIRGPALLEANQPEILVKQRIATYIEFDQTDSLELAIAAAKLRHELRHAEQRLSPRGDELFALDELADQIVKWKVGGLPGGVYLYNAKPTEIDANAAAAAYLRKAHTLEVPGILKSKDGVLARSKTPPEALDDLPAKTVAFIFQFREIAEDPARRGAMTFEERLASISDSAARCWRSLTSYS